MITSDAADMGGAPYHDRMLDDKSSKFYSPQTRNSAPATSSSFSPENSPEDGSGSKRARRKSVSFSDEVQVHQRSSAPSMGQKHVSKYQKRSESIFDDLEDDSNNNANNAAEKSSSSSGPGINSFDVQSDSFDPVNLTSMNERKRSALALEYQRTAAAELMKDTPDWPKLRRLIQLCEFQLMHTDPDSGNCTIHRASYTGAVDIIMYCLKQNASDVNSRNSLGRTPLMLAAEQDNKDAVKVLLEAGADPHLTTVGGMTALHFAAKANAEKATRVLLELVDDLPVEIEDNSRKTPLQVTSSQNIKDLLVQRISSQHETSADDFDRKY